MIDKIADVVRMPIKAAKDLIVGLAPQWNILVFVVISLVLSFLLLKWIRIDVRLKNLSISWKPIVIIGLLILIIFILG